MAYVSKELKERVRGLLREVVPEGWKWSLSGAGTCSLNLRISACPLDLPALYSGAPGNGFEVNTYLFKEHCLDGELSETIGKIVAAMNVENFDHSDSSVDYFHVGYYIHIAVGNRSKPFAPDLRWRARAEAKEISTAARRAPEARRAAPRL